MNTRDITKKKRKSRDSTGSSSSEKTESSKPPKDVLGLGQHLVRELGFDDQRDTLGRWMAHHVAELINDAKKGSTAAARSTARKTATRNDPQNLGASDITARRGLPSRAIQRCCKDSSSTAARR